MIVLLSDQSMISSFSFSNLNENIYLISCLFLNYQNLRSSTKLSSCNIYYSMQRHFKPQWEENRLSSLSLIAYERSDGLKAVVMRIQYDNNERYHKEFADNFQAKVRHYKRQQKFKLQYLNQMHGPQPGQQPPPLTREDWKKIQKSMKKPEFLGLLSEYMVQISDPKNKQQYDDYLRQMQTDGQLPKYMKLVQPQPQFCVKTGLVSERNKSQEMKFFINMCSAEEIQKPSFQAKMSETGEVGQSWKIPNSMGKIRYDQDVNGAICNTVDAVFHPETFAFARNKKFESMIITIAIQTAQRQLGERKQTLSKDYIVMEKLKCKGGTPAVLPIRSIEGKAYNKGEGGEHERDRDGVQTKLQKEIMDRKKQHLQKKEKQQAEKQKQKTKQQITEEDLNENPLSIESEHKGPHRPQFNTIYTYPVEYMDFIEGGVNKSNKYPTALNIEFKIPLVQQFKEIKSLDINEDKILLDAGEKYFIDLSLSELKIKYKLIHSDSKAKFDKKKKSLRITIPIDVASIKEKNVVQQPKQQEKPEFIQQKRDQESKQIVQDKTWQDKNKLLEISQPNVSTQIIKKSQIQEKEAKKFVQQVDEDDINLTQTNLTKQAQKPKEPAQQQPKTTSQLNFKFQEIRQKSFIILQLSKYKKQDLELIMTGSKIMLHWNTQKGNKYLNAVISREVTEKEVQVVYVVDFVVINIAKKDDTDKISIDSVETSYSEFLLNFERQKQVISEKKKLEMIEEQKKKQKQKNAEAEKKDKQQTLVQEQVKETKAEITSLIHPSQTAFKKSSNPQFLHFKISIVDELD